MINHFLTVLANPEYSQEYLPVSDLPWDVYVPARLAKSIPGDLIPIDHALFGDCATPDARKARAYHLTYLVSGTELSHAITEKDPRTTVEFPPRMAWSRPDSGISYCSEAVLGVPRGMILKLLDGDQVLLAHFYDGGTFVDRLAAITVAYVRKMENAK